MHYLVKQLKSKIDPNYLSDLTDEQLRSLYNLKEIIDEETKTRNDIYSPTRDYTGDYYVLIGGAGSGKSYEVADIIIDRLVNETKEEYGQPHRILCCRSQRREISESQFPLLRGRAMQRYPNLDWKFNRARGDESISINDNSIIFHGLDDPDKLKSIFDITSVWVEEADQIELDDFIQLELRLRGYSGNMQMYLSFNPTSVTSWLNERFFKGKDERTLTICGKQPFEDFTYWEDIDIGLDEINRKILDKVDTSRKGESRESYRHYYHTVIVHSTYLDNKFCDDKYYFTMDRLKRTDENYYNVYALGMWGVVGGGFFNKTNVMERKLYMMEYIAEHGVDIERLKPKFNKDKDRKPLVGVRKGWFVYEKKYDADTGKLIIDDKTIEFVGDKDGYITIYADPQPRTPYVLSADTAGEGSDFNAAIVTDNITKCDVSDLHKANLDSDLLAGQLYCLGKWYGRLNECANNSLLAVEINFNSAVQDRLLEFDYDNLYIAEEASDKISQRLLKKYGFRTTTRTRRPALDLLQNIAREKPEQLYSQVLLDEMLTVVLNEKSKPEAIRGAHDDMVMARAINCAVSDQQLDYETMTIDDPNISELPSDYIEDWYSASDKDKASMVADLRKMGYGI